MGFRAQKELLESVRRRKQALTESTDEDRFEYRGEPDDIDDRAPCRKCGAPVNDGEYDDNHGLCNACSEEEFRAEYESVRTMREETESKEDPFEDESAVKALFAVMLTEIQDGSLQQIIREMVFSHSDTDWSAFPAIFKKHRPEIGAVDRLVSRANRKR